MIYQRLQPKVELKHVVQEFWIFENDDPTIERQKIIPDGFFEIIFHYGDPYFINLHGSWEQQSMTLFAGQIDRYFYLENSGKSAMLGIKLNASATYSIFRKEMSEFKNKVVDLNSIVGNRDERYLRQIHDSKSISERVEMAERWIHHLIPEKKWYGESRIKEVINRINETKGMLNFQDMAKEVFISKRQLERDFKKSVGLSLKRYARIIRFNQIFEIMKEGDIRWVDLALKSGYYDQSHFIKDFKEFTGEEPSMYGFENENLANFFLRKS